MEEQIQRVDLSTSQKLVEYIQTTWYHRTTTSFWRQMKILRDRETGVRRVVGVSDGFEVEAGSQPLLVCLFDDEQVDR